MIEITTAKQGEKLKVNENNIFLMEPMTGAGTKIYFIEGVPNPEKSERPSKQLRVKEKPEELSGGFEKFEAVEDGTYKWLRRENILAKIPTEKGFRAYLPGDISGSSTPFGSRKIHIEEA